MKFFNTETSEGTLIVSLANPPYNSLNTDLFDEGDEFLSDLATNPPDGGVVMTGAGANFTRGMDIKIAAKFTAQEADQTRKSINLFCAGLHRLPCALVMAVNGHSIGAGGVMMLCADWVLTSASEHKIGLPEAKAGLAFPTVPQAIIDHWLDPVWRRRLALTSQLLAPQEAIVAGLVDEIVAPQALIRSAIERAQSLNAQPAFADCKRQLRAKANAEIDALLA